MITGSPDATCHPTRSVVFPVPVSEMRSLLLPGVPSSSRRKSSSAICERTSASGTVDTGSSMANSYRRRTVWRIVPEVWHWSTYGRRSHRSAEAAHCRRGSSAWGSSGARPDRAAHRGGEAGDPGENHFRPPRTQLTLLIRPYNSSWWSHPRPRPGRRRPRRRRPPHELGRQVAAGHQQLAEVGKIQGPGSGRR